MKPSRLLLPVLPFCAAVILTADPVARPTFRSGPHRTALIELFSSEGCSSCPPAEKWVADLADEAGLWRDFVPVAWHVDYWDGLGWPDRFASAANTERQKSYAAAWRSESIYTPGFVLNGKEWRGWRHPLGLPKAAKEDAGVLELMSTGGSRFTVRFSPPAGASAVHSATVAWLGNDLSSDVRRGENAGRKLRHSFIVLRSTTAVLARKGSDVVATVDLAPPEARDSKKLAVAAWVTRDGGQMPLQAVGGWLQPSP